MSAPVSPEDPTAPDSRGETLEDARDPLLQRELAGRYRILRLLGRGGMGAVYEAEAADGRRVALKVIARDAAGGSDEAVRRFLREARAVSSIDDPHVVRVLDTDRDDELGVPFIAMELLDGVDCATLFKQHAPLEPEPLVRLFLQAGRGLAAAHRRGVVHRDIKPANLFLHVARDTGEVTVKVCDFGIAKRVTVSAYDDTSQDLTATGRMMGSPMYMSPEQAKNSKDVDARTDVWSFAISLYEGLTGRRAWHGHTSLGEIILAICTEPLTPIQDLAPWVDPGLAEVVHRGILRDPAKRWPSMEEMLAALAPHAGSSEPLLRDDLRPVAEERRSRAAPRAAATSAEADTVAHVASTMGASARDAPPNPPSPTPRPKRRALVMGAAALVTLAAASAAWLQRAPRVDSTPLPAASSAPPTPAAPAPAIARVRIEPPTAAVRVDGVPAEVGGGFVTLHGKAGDVMVLEVSLGEARKSVSVVITSSGQALPPFIELQALPAASATARPTAAPANAAPAQSGAPRAKKASTPGKAQDPSDDPGF